MLTRFEKARILGARTIQLSMGAPPGEGTRYVDPLKIAETEMDRGDIPMAIKREERR